MHPPGGPKGPPPLPLSMDRDRRARSGAGARSTGPLTVEAASLQQERLTWSEQA